MIYFEQDFIEFFKELKINNHKDWFHENKKRYENSVKKPFEKFVDDLIVEIRSEGQDIELSSRDCILRINRDIRFSKDKTPYNLHYTAFVSPGGRKDKSAPGLFIRFSPKMIGIMGGCFGPDKEQLSRIRKSIATNPKAFRELLEDKSFKHLFGEIKGEEIKRIPKELQHAVIDEPLVAKKQFYFVNELKPDVITSDTLMVQVMNHWKTMRPVNEFLSQALNS